MNSIDGRGGAPGSSASQRLPPQAPPLQRPLHHTVPWRRLPLLLLFGEKRPDAIALAHAYTHRWMCTHAPGHVCMAGQRTHPFLRAASVV
jgi:hypothetical protein